MSNRNAAKALLGLPDLSKASFNTLVEDWKSGRAAARNELARRLPNMRLENLTALASVYNFPGAKRQLSNRLTKALR
jgi:hypothetical protein